MAKCKGCGAEIIWIKMYGSNKRMPADPEPVNVLYGEGQEKFVREDGVVFIGRKIGDAWDDDPNAKVMTGFVSHFATCKKADDFRGRGA